MLFNSYTFILFMAIVLIAHNLSLSWRFRKFNLLIFSYIFYAAWNPPFVILLWVSTVVDWFAAKRLHRTHRPASRRFYLLISLCVNLGLLGFFKYSGFLLDNFITLLRQFHIQYQPPALDIILPVGISFYTFQTLSYTIDIYRRKAAPWHSFLDYALYVTFFPQLVAGPIVRATDFLPQCNTSRRTSRNRLGWGLTMLVLGLFEKIVVSDGLFARWAEVVYSTPDAPGVLTAWAGTLAFSGQIFCDFAGYSTCAIGVAMCLGFDIPSNFLFPYAAIGFSDFWRRWHISLSSWLRDYLYIPLGGNRVGPVRAYVNLMTTMLLGGLWHGAAWTFVVWGGLHGVYLVVERLLKKFVPPSPFWRRKPTRAGLALFTYLLVLFTWVFFRARTFGHAFCVLGSMFGVGTASATVTLSGLEIAAVFTLSAMLLIVHWMMRELTLEELAERTPWFAKSLVIALMLVAIVTLSGEDRAFIYFQF